MKIRLLNSPWDFDEVGDKAADRWLKQGKAYYTPDGLMLKDNFVLGIMRRQRADQLFESAVAESVSVRVWQTRHSGEPLIPGAPRCGVKQFVTIKPSERIN